MGKACRLAVLVWVAVCGCAANPALAQGRNPERRPRQEPLGAYILQTEEEARLRAESAEQSERLSRVEGRLDGIDEATTRAAAAGEKAAGAAEGVLTTVRWCTIVVSALVVLVGALLVVVGLAERKNIEAIRQRAEGAVEKAEAAVRRASECAATSAKSLEEMQQSERRARELLESAEEMRGEIADRREKVTVDAAVVADLRKQVEAGAKIDPAKEVSAEERETLEDASRAADRLEDLGEELSAEAHLVRGGDYFLRGEYERALAEADHALRLRPDYAGAHYNRGTALIFLHRCQEALVAFDRVIELLPDFDSAHYNRACAGSVLKRRDEALRDLKRAIELDAKYREKARADEDFEGLRQDPEFRKLVGLDEESGE